MDADFFYYSIYDRFIQRQLCACIRKLFFKKLLRNCGLDFYKISQNAPSLNHYRKIWAMERYLPSSASSFPFVMV